MDATPRFRFLVAAAMRDEGAFLIEWVTWYRMLGFDRILVVTNDCTDHSVELLTVLQDAEWLCHAAHRPRAGEAPKISAHRAMRAHALARQTEWMFICDADEFLALHAGGGSIGGFIDLPRRPFLGMAFHWRSFGDAGQTTWHDGLVHRTFRMAAEHRSIANASFKSIFRTPMMFRLFREHAPRGYKGDFGTGDAVWVNSKGHLMHRFNTQNPGQMATAPGGVTHRYAQLNHYIVRSTESFALKRGTPSASARLDRYTDAFDEKYNRNDQKDNSALGYRAAFDAMHVQAMAIPGVRRLHHLCCADYVVRLAALAGRAPRDDPRYAFHMDQAASAG